MQTMVRQQRGEGFSLEIGRIATLLCGSLAEDGQGKVSAADLIL